MTRVPPQATELPSRQARRLGAALVTIALTGAMSVAALLPAPSPASAAPVTGMVDLGLASTYAVLSGASVGNTVNAPTAPHTTLRGDLGVKAAAEPTGFPPGIVTGATRVGATADGAHAALVTAYTEVNNRTGGAVLPAILAGQTLTPGLYESVGAVSNTGTLILDAQNNATAVFVLQVNGALTAAASSHVTLINGALASRVFWQMDAAASIGATSTFAGTIMALDAIAVGAGTVVNGRAFSRTGAIGLDSNEFYSTPPVVTITGGATVITTNTTPTISGTTDIVAPSVVTVSITGQAPITATPSGGTWSVTTGLLPNAQYTVVAAVTDGAGNPGSATQTLTVDTVLPLVSIDGPPTLTTNDVTPTITGSTDVAVGSVVLVDFGTVTRTALVQVGGTWNVTPPTLGEGTRIVTASVTDPAGNPGTITQSLTIDTTPPAVTIDGGANALTNDATPTLIGTADVPPGSAVTITVADETLNATAQSGGAWSATAAAMSNGPHLVVVLTADAAGNPTRIVQRLTVDTVLPLISITGGSVVTTNDLTPTITGTTDVAPGTLISVDVAGQSLLAVVQTNQTWNATPSSMALGVFTVVATVVDPAGNVGRATQALTLAALPPVVIVPVIPDPGESEPGTAITGGGAVPGSSVTVVVAGQTLTTTVGGDGTWSVLPIGLSPGYHMVQVVITSPSGARTVLVDGVVVGSAPDYTPVGPKRVFDTRPNESAGALRQVEKRPIDGEYELQVRLTDLSGLVPADGVGAVSLNVTATESTADGVITVYACGSRELVSSVNYAKGRNVANAVIAPVSAAGTVCFFSNVPTHVVVDINGWFAEGRAFTPVGPKRIFDTRASESPDAMRKVPKQRIAADGVLEVRMTDLPGYVPAGGVGSVSLNVTVTNPDGPGVITVYTCGVRELVSSVNYVAGQTVANAVITSVSGAGSVCFHSSAAVDLVVDLNGWFKSGSGFTGMSPKRVVDTRADESPNALRTVAKRKIGGAYVLEVQMTNLPGVVPATGVAAVSLNVTATGPEGAGFITVFACGTMEQVSSVNYAAGQTVANAVLAPLSPTGTICIYSFSPVDVVVDINGWVAGAA